MQSLPFVIGHSIQKPISVPFKEEPPLKRPMTARSRPRSQGTPVVHHILMDGNLIPPSLQYTKPSIKTSESPKVSKMSKNPQHGRAIDYTDPTSVPFTAFHPGSYKKHSVKALDQLNLETQILIRLKVVIQSKCVNDRHLELMSVLNQREIPSSLIQKYFGPHISSLEQIRLLLIELLPKGLDTAHVPKHPLSKDAVYLSLTKNFPTRRYRYQTPQEILDKT